MMGVSFLDAHGYFDAVEFGTGKVVVVGLEAAA